MVLFEILLTVIGAFLGGGIAFKFIKFNQKNIDQTGDNNTFQAGDMINNINILNRRVEKLEKKSYRVIEKLMKVLKYHNVKKSNFLQFFPKRFKIDLECFENQEHFYKKINSGEILPWLSKQLNLDEKWFYDEVDYLYNYTRKYFYKDIDYFIEYILNLVLKKKDFDVYLLKTSSLDCGKDDRKQEVYMIFKIKQKMLKNGEAIYKYQFSSDVFYWDYWRSSFELKTMIYLYEEVFKRHFCCYDTTSEKVVQFKEGKIGFSDLFNSFGYSWYASDYVPPLHMKSKEVEKYDELNDYMKSYIVNLKGKLERLPKDVKRKYRNFSGY